MARRKEPTAQESADSSALIREAHARLNQTTLDVIKVVADIAQHLAMGTQSTPAARQALAAGAVELRRHLTVGEPVGEGYEEAWTTSEVPSDRRPPAGAGWEFVNSRPTGYMGMWSQKWRRRMAYAQQEGTSADHTSGQDSGGEAGA